MAPRKVRGSHSRPNSLSHGRPKPVAGYGPSTGKATSIGARHTRRVIRQHHTLQKQHAAALAAGDEALAASIAQKIEDAGGLQTYQQASRTGQSKERGGDASALLVKWLDQLSQKHGHAEGKGKIRMLDVGALTCDTAASKSGKFDEIVRIDLNSNEKAILKQDFMERPLPRDDREKFEVVSLSLVLNYVPEATTRGQMLKHVRHFLLASSADAAREVLPCVFIVLPAPCILNSRYLTPERFDAILESLGFAVIERKTSAKLVYLLCSYVQPVQTSHQHFRKVEVHSGYGRNNFAIILE